MKRQLFIYICWACMFLSMPVAYADEDCDLSLLEAQQAYNAGDYAKAKSLFEYVVKECGADYGNATAWIKKCSASRTPSTKSSTIPTSNVSISRCHPGEPVMVFVQGGTFLMGCTDEQDDDCDNDELPNHLVTVSDFYIGKYEVTQAQWEAVMGTGISLQRDKENKGLPLYGVGANYPMYYVSWNEAQEFISRLNALTGKQYRLPTEAEWEYAARGGRKSRGYKYSGSNSVERVTWFTDNSMDTTHPVGTKSPNELGIYDMSGNVWEWCYDWYDSYNDTQQTNPQGPPLGLNRVLRGGGWYSSTSDCRVAYRNANTLDDRSDDVGFRLVLSH